MARPFDVPERDPNPPWIGEPEEEGEDDDDE